MTIKSTLGSKIREERKRLNIPLRKFARQLNITAPYIVDIEKDRRQPSRDLLARIADALGLPFASLELLHSKTDPEVVEWIEQQPSLRSLLRRIKDSPRSHELLQNLSGVVEQRQAVLLSPVVIYESELQAIGLEAASWGTETGGDLFGLWETLPIVYLATRAGPNAIRNHAHFKLDVGYLRQLSIELDSRWGLRYLGDWHSHHRLGLTSPSSGDEDRIKRLGVRNGFLAMVESIVTFEDEHGSASPIIRVHPYVYTDLQSGQPVKVPFIVLKGISPLREALIAHETLKEQNLDSWTRFPMERLCIPPEPLPRTNPGEGNLFDFIGEQVLGLARAALETASGEVVEHHRPPFGHILVARDRKNNYVGIALDAAWPYPVLEVDWIDRGRGTSEPLEIPLAQRSALNPRQLVELFTRARNLRSQIEEKDGNSGPTGTADS